jgi:AtzE family amidohydrolase
MTTLMNACAVAALVRRREVSATEVVKTALGRIAARDAEINAFTEVLESQALKDAAAVDAALARGEDPGPLAGATFAAKNLFDIEGVTTLAGSIIERRRAAAVRDAFAVAGLKRAGAVCVGALNMDEYAYGFTTENAHYGPTRNPHDVSRIVGGSSGGSAAAVAAGFVHLSLGSDTNGSIRVPASLNGVFGIKPTYGRLSRAGAVLFVPSLDHVGPFARSVADLAAVYDAMLGEDPDDPVQVKRAADAVTPELGRGLQGLRAARLGGYFRRHGTDAVQQATARVARALGGEGEVELPEAAAARAAAYVITAAEGAALRLDDLRQHCESFSPLSRDRLLAGALVPAQWVLHAQRLRSLFRREVAAAFHACDILVAPATPVVATMLGQDVLEADGERVALRPSLGVYTQPISFVGLPVLTVPVQHVEGALPVGVQLIGAPWSEALLFRAAAQLEADGICSSMVAPDFR